jgi:hypothetical protein
MNAIESVSNALHEASALRSMIKAAQSTMSREEIMVAVQWETARFAYLQNRMPEFWKLTAEKNRPETNLPMQRVDELLGNKHFPKQWGQVPQSKRPQLVKRLLGDQTIAARFLSGFEGVSQALRFVKSHNLSKPAPSKMLPMDDGGFVAVVRVYPACGWNMICGSLKKELKEAGWPQDGRRNANDVPYMVTHLKGLAALWLENAGESPAKQNKQLFPTQTTKYDYTSLKEAKQRASTEVDKLVQMLTDLCRPWTEMKAFGEESDNAFFTAIKEAQGVSKGKRKKRRESTPISGSKGA